MRLVWVWFISLSRIALPHIWLLTILCGSGITSPFQKVKFWWPWRPGLEWSNDLSLINRSILVSWLNCLGALRVGARLLIWWGKRCLLWLRSLRKLLERLPIWLVTHVGRLTMSGTNSFLRGRLLNLAFGLVTWLISDMWTLLSLSNIRHLMASPPCPPWCSMASQMGLASEDGRLMGDVFRKARDLGAASVVLGKRTWFQRAHARQVRLWVCGKCRFLLCYRIKTDNCTGVLPLNRCRWLATFVAHDIRLKFVHITRVHTAMNIALPSNPFLGGLRGCDALFKDMPEEDPAWTASIKRSNPDYVQSPKLVPKWWGKGLDMSKDETVLKSRVTKPESPMTCLVASYGKQHNFGYDYLEQRGLCCDVGTIQ